MISILRIGDPHAKPNNIEESESLIQYAADIAIEFGVKRIEILGDLFHTHAVLRLEVLEFWTWALELLTDICEVVVLVGNHDMSGDYNSSSSALDIFVKTKMKNLKIVNIPRVEGVFGYVPYIHDPAKFVEHANHLVSYGAKVLVCHQTFKGSKYESGMYTPDGIDVSLLSQEFVHVISGHIHARQEFGRVKYPGTPRWDTTADANQPKGITYYEHDDTTGKILTERYLSTEGICSPIVQLSFAEGEQIDLARFPKGSRIAVELVGSSDWVSKQKLALKGKCAIKTKITDAKKTVARQVGKGFEDFLRNLYETDLNKEELVSYAKELGIV